MSSYLKRDIRSTVNPKCLYGKKGEKVKIINRRDHVLIVSDTHGNRFPVNVNDVITTTNYIANDNHY